MKAAQFSSLEQKKSLVVIFSQNSKNQNLVVFFWIEKFYKYYRIIELFRFRSTNSQTIEDHHRFVKSKLHYKVS